MKKKIFLFTLSFIIIGIFIWGCNTSTSGDDLNLPSLTGSVKIILLHHSTGLNIWNGGVSAELTQYNSDNSTDYAIAEQAFPSSVYSNGWSNYPYDYWNIWVQNAGESLFEGTQPTLEILTAQYDVIIWKHCYPVSNVQEDSGSPDISSQTKQIEIYKLQYNALKTKMKSFPNTRFIVWTGAARINSEITEVEAIRAKTFFSWVKDSWDEIGDNIFIWDFHQLETEGTLYLKPEYSDGDSHPNSAFSSTVAPYLVTRIVDVIDGSGDSKDITGNY